MSGGDAMNEPFSIARQPGSVREGWVEELTRLVAPETVVRRNELLLRRTTLRVGGPADLYLEPASESDLRSVVRFCAGGRIPFFVLGRGSNLLARDGGYRGVVLCLAHPHFSGIEVAGTRLRCGAGARLKAVAMEARRQALAGFEFLEGIPGSVGGALRMNAGAMGGATFDVVVSARLMNAEGEVREWTAVEMAASYRECATLKTHIAMDALFGGQPGARDEIERRMNEFSRKRWGSQPAAPSAGCTFKNPRDIPAGRLIEELGLKGTRCGGASVSLEHANFIVNDGAATAQDILDLIDLIRQRARRERGVDLETEVEIIGEPVRRTTEE
jgi:UDP-N-acetylenolpyruvoylglucosamine reductase